MTADRDRTYIVLAVLPGDVNPEHRQLVRLGPGDEGLGRGVYRATSPEMAIGEAAAHGLPREDGGPVVAVPMRNWHERVVGYARRPVIETPVDAEVVD